MNTTVKDVGLYRAISPLTRPIADSTHRLTEISFYVVEVLLESGVRGQGYLLAFHYSPGAIRGALQDMVPLVKGYAANETVRLEKDALSEQEYFGQEGIQRWALAIFNVAMWDAWCKTLEQPIWKVLGTCVEKVPVYGSGGWLSYSLDELIDEVVSYKKRGFQAVKIKVGGGLERDLERLRKVREAVGSDLRIMMDANQGMTLPDALELSAKASEISIFWFEEPLNHRDYDGYTRLRTQNTISLAMGEREYDMEALKALAERHALDLWQPDIIRIGGVEPWLRSAAFAGAHHIPVLPHYYKDYDIPLLCTISNGIGAESFDWIDGIIDTPMKIVDGLASPRSGAGWGFSFLEKYLEKI